MPTHKIKNLTGPGETTRFGMEATDLGVPVRMPDGRLLFFFGDTFKGARVGDRDWRSPVGLISSTKNWADGVTFSAAAGTDPNTARQLVPYTHNALINGKSVSTVLPTDALVVGKTIYLHVMVCQGLGNVLWTEIWASRDNARTWTKTGRDIPGDKWSGRFQMRTWARGGDGWVYVFSTGFQRDKGLILSRVPEGRVAEYDAYEPWGYKNNRWAWGNAPTDVLTGRFGELNLRRVDNRWVLTFFDAEHYRIDSVLLSSPTANLFTAPRVTVCQGGAWGGENDATGIVAQLYGGYIIPGSTLKNCHFVVSQWNTRVGWPYRSMQFAADLLGPPAPQ